MVGFSFRRRRVARPVGAAEGHALAQALRRIGQQAEGGVRREAESVLRQVLVAESYGEAAHLARRVLHGFALGPEPRAALIAGRCWALRSGLSLTAPPVAR